jgi:uncharacterized membrane protein YphA (DoxX/SURF4 family)
MDHLHIAAWLTLRVTYGLLFLLSAGVLAWDWRRSVERGRPLLGALAGPGTAAAGAVMAAGGLSVALGVYGRVGAALLALFLVPATAVHVLELRRARRAGQGRVEPGGNVIAELSASAATAHLDSALKNTALAGVAVFLMVMGTGPGSLWT